MGVKYFAALLSEAKVLGTLNILLPMVLIKAKGVFSTNAHSIGRFTYSLALLIVIGRTPLCNPPRAPPTHKTAASAKERKLIPANCLFVFGVLKSETLLLGIL